MPLQREKKQSLKSGVRTSVIDPSIHGAKGEKKMEEEEEERKRRQGKKKGEEEGRARGRRKRGRVRHRTVWDLHCRFLLEDQADFTKIHLALS